MKEIKRGFLFHSKNGSQWVITKVNMRKKKVYYKRVKGETISLPIYEFEEYLDKNKEEKEMEVQDE